MKRVRFNISAEAGGFNSSDDDDDYDDEDEDEDDDEEQGDDECMQRSQDAVELIRSRLEEADCSLDTRSRILFQKLLGTRLLQQLLEPKWPTTFPLAEEAMHALDCAFQLAQQELPATDDLRLVCCQTYCLALCMISNDAVKARAVAEECFHLAHSRAHELTDEAITILEQIRKRFMISSIATATVKPLGTQSKRGPLRQQLDSSSTPTRATKTDNMASLDDFRSLQSSRPSPAMAHQTNSIPIAREEEAATLPSAPSLSLNFPGIRSAIRGSTGLPVQLDTLPEAAQILSALDQIFRLYVRGFAIPGQQHDGANVNLVGQKMAFGAFLLDGPYMSWDGFLRFCFDFRLARLPASVLQTFGHRVCACEDISLVLTHAQLAVVFAESSRSNSPALIARKFSERYCKISEMPDPWEDVVRSFQDTAAVPAPSTGLNFLQFIDCIAKCALVGYADNDFQHILPRAEDKLKHLLTGHLSLSDRNRWLPRIAFQDKSRLREQFKGAPLKMPSENPVPRK